MEQVRTLAEATGRPVAPSIEADEDGQEGELARTPA